MIGIKLRPKTFQMNNALLFIFLIILIFSCGSPNDLLENHDNISIGERDYIYSNILEEERELWIHVPPDYYTMNEANMVYPVVYLMDPTEQFASTVGILQQLSISNANNFCPPMIIVGIRHEDRSSDLPPRSKEQTYDSPGGADLVLEFLEKEVIPYIDDKYSSTPHRVLIGHSLGGLFVFNALIDKPHLFSNYLNIDPAMFWQDGAFAQEVMDSLETKNFKGKKLYLATANNYTSWITEETIDADTSEIAVMTKYSLDFEKSLDKIKPQNLAIQNHYYKNEIHGSVPVPATVDAFKYFYKDYLYDRMMDYYKEDYPDDGAAVVADIEKHYEKLSDQLGYKVLPLESYINAYAFGLTNFNKHDIPKSLLELNKKNYPESDHVHEALDFFNQ